MYVCMYVCMYYTVYICMYVCMYVYMLHVCMYECACSLCMCVIHMGMYYAYRLGICIYVLDNNIQCIINTLTYIHTYN